jgi:hypothetical protein
MGHFEKSVPSSLTRVPQGLGIVFWYTEDLHQFPRGKEREHEARRLFTPIASCRPLMRVQFLPFAAELVARMMRELRRR